MLLSIIIPAFNEEKELPHCLESVAAAVTACRIEGETEVVVCDNNSTDRTAEVAQSHGARVIFEPVNQISRARNAGAAVATGEWFLFIDADSRLGAENLRRVAECARTEDGVVGGGSVIGLIGVPWWVAPGVLAWNLYSLAAGRAAGSFLFCRGKDFRAIAGFSEELFAAEELDFSLRLSSHARRSGRRFIMLRGHPHLSSGRKFRLFTPGQLLRRASRLLVHPRRIIRSRDDLDYFYDGRR